MLAPGRVDDIKGRRPWEVPPISAWSPPQGVVTGKKKKGRGVQRLTGGPYASLTQERRGKWETGQLVGLRPRLVGDEDLGASVNFNDEVKPRFGRD
jgi:hypothetical protein